MIARWAVRVAVVLAVLSAPARAAAAEITVLCPRGVQHVVAAVAEDFQKATRDSVWMSYGTTAGIAERALTETADVVIGSAAGLTELQVKGAVRTGTQVVLGSVGIGVAVPAGTPPPDVSTSAALRRAVLEAASLGFPDPAQGGQAGRHFNRVLESMNVAPLVRFKTTLFPDGLRALEALAKGQIALAVAPVSEIAAAAGVALAGPLPEDVQQVLVYVGAVMSRSGAPDVARAFLAHLTSAAARTRFKAGGIVPPE